MEEAFNFYESVFGGTGNNGLVRCQPLEGMPPMPEEDKILLMHIEWPIASRHALMGTDALNQWIL